MMCGDCALLFVMDMFWVVCGGYQHLGVMVGSLLSMSVCPQQQQH